MPNYELKWTQKVKLNRVIDPLGLRGLKILEERFLQGITTQTERLRYFTLLTWAYKKIEEEEIDIDEILQIEKIFTLVAQNHHMKDDKPPRGIRNSRSAEKLLRSAKSFSVKKFTSFGVGGRNKEGYGHYYYRNPSRVLGILKNAVDGETIVSNVGRKIANSFGKVGEKHPFKLNKLSTVTLSRYRRFCLCREEIPERERSLWRNVFFGFSKVGIDGSIDFDMKASKTFCERGVIDSAKFQDWHKLESDSSFFEDILDIHGDRASKRGYTLLLIMKIIDEANPNTSVLNQTIRDAIYFKQVISGSGSPLDIEFGKLEHLRSLWEVYVHNLYYISVLEGIFDLLLQFLETKPFGASINAAASHANIKRVQYLLKEIAFPKNFALIEDMSDYVKRKLGFRSSLHFELNEREVFLKSQRSETIDETLAYFLTLLVLLKHRFQSFNDQQVMLLQYTEQDLLELSPSSFYQNSLRGTIEPLFQNVLRLVKDRHRLVSSRKYIDGTKSWLITEEGKLLFHYGKHHYWTPYREAKWRNVVELLYDMGLIDREGDVLKASRMGRKWLRSIM